MSNVNNLPRRRNRINENEGDNILEQLKEKLKWIQGMADTNDGKVALLGIIAIDPDTLKEEDINVMCSQAKDINYVLKVIYNHAKQDQMFCKKILALIDALKFDPNNEKA